jgi:conjugal transfer pilus assembly protein TraK
MRRSLIIGTLLALASGPACANLFQANAESSNASLAPPPAPPAQSTSPLSVPPPPHNAGSPVGAFPNAVPQPPVTQGPGVAPGGAATGFAPVAQPKRLPGQAPIVRMPGYNPQNRRGSQPMPPPLPNSVITHNAHIAQTASKPPVVIPSSPYNLKNSDIKGQYVVHSAAEHIVVGADSLANVAIHVSGYAPNEILTPFHHPRVISTQKGTIQYVALGNKAVISVVPTHPVGILLTGSQPNDPAVNLTLIPKAIPGRNFKLDIQDWQPNPIVMASAHRHSARATHILHVMAAVAQGQVPSGYGRSNRLPFAQQANGLHLTPIIHFNGTRHSLVEYRVRNLNANPVTLSENDFYKPGVAAVAFWPSGRMAGHGHIRVYILSTIPRTAHNTLGFLGKE